VNKAVIFDLDQTLLDTNSVAHLRDARNWSEIYKIIPSLSAFEGIDNIMEFLYENDINVIVITTSPGSYCSRIITHCGWKVNGQICYHDVSRRKPDPESFLKALKDYNLDIKQTISAGDKDIDIVASNSAGIPSIACTWASPNVNALLGSNPKFIANNVSELFNIIQTFFSKNQ
jgi:phosphoglycolate phosphatase-like HAD superfamily hydrolase